MDEKTRRRAPFDRGAEQAIVALKKGAHLLKCGRRGKPMFCPFRLSTDEKYLIWYSGEKEKCLQLSCVSNILLGQKTANFLRHLKPEKECHSFSLIYQNSERSLDLICKDKEQAECWVLGLTSLLSIYPHIRPLACLKTGRVAHSCVNSPICHVPTNYELQLLHHLSRFPQNVCSVYGSPPRKLVEKYGSERFFDSSNLFYSSRQRTLSDVQRLMDEKLPILSNKFSVGLKNGKVSYQGKELIMNSSTETFSTELSSPTSGKGDSLKDIFMWGEGVGLFFGDRSNAFDTNGMKVDVLLPKLLESTRMLDVDSISCGEKHAALVTKHGEVFCWGEGNGGKLGNKISVDMTHPKIVESLGGAFVQKIACSSVHTCAVTSSGELYTWGGSLVYEGGDRSYWIPHRLCNLDRVKVLKVACGESHSAIVSTSGQLFTYGEGLFGALGHGNLQSSSQPKEVESLKGLRVKSVACGPWHTAAIVEIIVSRFKSNSTSGKLFTWGDGDKGKLGHADKEKKLLPTCIASLVDCDFVQVSCGRALTVALTVNGMVFTMGSAMYGQLGNPWAEDTSITSVEGCLKNEFVKNVSSGAFHVVVLTTKGNVYTWGKGENGRLGLGDTKDRDSPCLVEALQDRDVQNLVCGSSFTAAVCLHKSYTSKEQSLCTGCQAEFGFTKRKHNCYNCGCAFCHSCSSKKAMNASLARSKVTRSRVCDMCFARLEKLTKPRGNDEVTIPRQFSMTHKGLSDAKIMKDEAFFSLPKIFTPKLCNHHEPIFVEGKATFTPSEVHKDKCSFLGGASKWGEVSCPPQFKSCMTNEPMAFVPKSKEGSSDDALISALDHPKSMLSKAASLKATVSEPNKALTEELQRLHSKAVEVAQQRRSRSLKLQQYNRRIKENWLLARDEAAKCNASTSFIKVLKAQMSALSDTMTRDGAEVKGSSIGHELTRETTDPVDTTAVQNSLRCTKGSPEIEKEARICSSNGSRHEWVEQYELGVYVSFTMLPNGQKGLKRLRFSRRRFNRKQAERWWEENRFRILQKYSIQLIDTTPTRNYTHSS